MLATAPDLLIQGDIIEPSSDLNSVSVKVAKSTIPDEETLKPASASAPANPEKPSPTVKAASVANGYWKTWSVTAHVAFLA
ncbi:unnamed protein product [Arabis nemorensis]|uniref:Uncharacterized protein n=1 Tax=Arabis nemorensis TaxID=586526 RepID=A0A565BJW4_9BRAS|nr:unnamed protein product [Arabis nemorensis]